MYSISFTINKLLAAALPPGILIEDTTDVLSDVCNELLDNKEFSAYLRLDVKDKHGVLSNITKTLSKNKVSIKRLIQHPYKSKKNSSIIIITHKAKDIF